MKKQEIQKIIREEIKKTLSEEIDKSTVNSYSFKLSVETDDSKGIATLKQDGKTIAVYEYGGAGATKVKKADTKALCDSLADIIWHFRGR